MTIRAMILVIVLLLCIALFDWLTIPTPLLRYVLTLLALSSAVFSSIMTVKIVKLRREIVILDRLLEQQRALRRSLEERDVH